MLEHIIEGGKISDTLDNLCRDTEAIDPAMRCSVLYFDMDAQCLRHAAAPSLPDFYNDAIDGLQVGVGVGSCGTAASTGERVIVEDVFSHPYWRPFRDLAKKAGFHACWSQPILSKNKDVLGTFAMYHDEVRRPTEEELLLIQDQANLAGLAIERMQAEKALRESEALRKSEERLRKIFEISPAGISIVSIKTNKRLYINPMMAELFGAESVDQLLNHDLRATYANTADLDYLRSKSGDDFITEMEVERLRLDGGKWWSMVHRRPIEYEGQNAALGWHFDVTERTRGEKEVERLNRELERRVEERTSQLRKSRGLFKAVVDNSPTKIHIKDVEGRYTLINREAENLFGVSDVDGCGKTSYDLFPRETADAFTAHDQTVIEVGAPMEEEEEFTLGDGVHTFLTTKFPIFDQNGITGIGAVGIDITKRKRAEKALRESERRLAHLAATDPLTGTDNRRSFFEKAERELRRARRYKRPVSLLMIDIDHFKSINDSHGHALGDRVLNHMVEACRGILREQDILGRLGGEEFAVVLIEENLAAAGQVAERLRQAVEALEVATAGDACRFTISIGVCECAGEPETLGKALERADQALYAAKKNGRNRVAAEPCMTSEPSVPGAP